MITSIRDRQIAYPETDFKPMAENTLQFDWIQLLYTELDERFSDRNDVFIAGDLFWYPVEGRPDIVQAPDVMLAFGRPKGYRGSYLQWKEDDIAPQVVFEVWSPGNTASKLKEKFKFYQKYGVEEYYLIDPFDKTVKVYRRRKQLLTPIRRLAAWRSPRLGIRLETVDGDLVVFGPEGRKFVRPTERIRSQTAQIDNNRKQAERERKAKETLAAKLRELGVDPDTLLP
jgi:Uma2 family endonuclease